MSWQVLYPDGVGEHHDQKFRDGPTFSYLSEASEFLWQEFEKCTFCKPDSFGIPFKTIDGDLVAYAKRRD